MKSVFIVYVFVVLLLSLKECFSARIVKNDDITTIRKRVLELSIWPPAENVPKVVEAAIGFNRTLNSSCYWKDVDYFDQSIVVWKTEVHLFRLTTMLQALTVNGSRVQNDPGMLANAHCVLNVWLVHNWTNPNWWFNEIGIPLELTSELLMLGEHATSFELEKITEITYRSAWWIPNPAHVGANVLWEVQVEIYRSLATRNLTGIEQGFTRVWQDIQFSSTEEYDVQQDWSYHFHLHQLMSGAYGVVWVNSILLFLECSRDTQYQPKEEQLEFFANFLTKGDAWMMPNNTFDWHTLGRGISVPNTLGHQDLTTSSMRTLAELIQSQDLKEQLTNFIDRLENKPNVPALIGNRYYFVSDYIVHRRRSWIATIKMQSMRTQPVECILGQNIKDEHGGQGVLNVYKPGTNDYFNIFPIIDWQAINGITVEHGIPLGECVRGSFSIKRMMFVGGASDEQYGMTFMDTATYNLTAKRSWHFFDDAIIALATNLTLTTPTTAWTTLASRLLSVGDVTIGFFNSTVVTFRDGNYSIPYTTGQTSNVQWIHIGGSNIGYLLQSQRQYASIEIEFGTKTGDFNTIGPFNFEVTARMVTLAINHGIGPYTLDYNYMILPNVSLESIPQVIKQYDEEQVFACTSTANSNLHGVLWPSLKRASFVLWENVTTTFSCKSPTFELNIQFHDAGAYLYSETDTEFTLTTSHPTRTNAVVNVVVVDRKGQGQGCVTSSSMSSLNASQTTVSLVLPSRPELTGASVNVTCTK